jgi:hypothetical protein
MAFNINYLGRVNTSANSNALKHWSYNATATGSNEAIATVAGAGYFNNAQQNLTNGTEAGLFAVDDVIDIHGNDANGMYVVSSITTNVTVGSYAAIGAVDTANIAANAVTTAKLAEGLVVTSGIVDVTLAEFVGSYTASLVLVAAPGANKKLILHRANLWINYGGTVLANGGAMHVQYDNTANGAGTKATGTLAAATLIGATADTSFGFSPVDTTLTDATTLNKGLYLAMATADFTGGDASVYKVKVDYSVLDVS